MTKPHRLSRLVSVSAITSAALFLSSCGYVRDSENHPLTTLDPKGPQAQMIDDLSTPVFAVAGVVFVLIQALMIYLIVRYRRRPDDVDGVDEPTQIHGMDRLEWAWTITPAVILAGLAILNVQTIWKMEERNDPNMITVEIIGQQWWWEYRYDFDADGSVDVITANQMVIPEDTLVDLHIRSNDVIHSFWIPALNGKRDAVPGRTNRWLLQADDPGLYEGTCTEFCGLSHAYMRMEVKALDSADWEQWKSDQLEPANIPADPTPDDDSDDDAVLTGYKTFIANCASCHQLNGVDAGGEETDGTPDADYRGEDHPLTAGNAPNLTHLMSRNRYAGNLFSLWTTDSDGNYTDQVDTSTLGDWLRDPGALKPMAADANRGMPNLQLSEDQISSLVAFLSTLK
ncbi:MAG: cytochrome c oxidase subunit II [Microthrixaceae bacterium]|nr:cytochrome c oxidase subunit II [Microthrixaceae bacterium]MCO5311691.1 cytochrome c oxidase subunit II [Microthrixaceae bacterium]HPB46555.1 cytochrome c oxidase subunit II [Microthrixaceae bacterium]